MSQLAIQSRSGNVTLAVEGLVFALGGLVLLAVSIATTLEGASLTERVLQLGLLGCVGAGVVLLRMATSRLRRAP